MDMIDSATPSTIRRLGLDWCEEHRQPIIMCRTPHAAKDGEAPPKKPPSSWGGHNALRRYIGLMIKGQEHPFQQAGGRIVGVQEGNEALAASLAQAPVQRIALDSLVTTSDVTPSHIGLMLRGKAPEVRLSGPFDSADTPTVLRIGNHHVLADGHHRATAAWASGATHLKVRVLTDVTPVFENSTDLLLRPS